MTGRVAGGENGGPGQPGKNEGDDGGLVGCQLGQSPSSPAPRPPERLTYARLLVMDPQNTIPDGWVTDTLTIGVSVHARVGWDRARGGWVATDVESCAMSPARDSRDETLIDLLRYRIGLPTEPGIRLAVEAVLAQVAGGEFATGSRDFGRGAAEVARRVAAAADLPWPVTK